jgi:hypothetical protein
MGRRNFIKAIAATGSFLFLTPLFAKAKKYFNLKMNGELDDDIIVFKRYYNSDDFKSIVCYQMHNMSKRFRFGSHIVSSVHIPGYVKLKKDIEIEKDGITCISTANEREDVNPTKKLTYRTHYKSTRLFINEHTLFPSIIPENNDVSKYPTWYLAEEDGFASNYYRLWENATVFNGFITHEKGRHLISLYNKHNELMAVSKVDIQDTEPQQVIFKSFNSKPITKKHIFTEINDFVFDGENNTQEIDKEIQENAVFKVIIENSKGIVSIDLPYGCPYINTYFMQGVEIE